MCDCTGFGERLKVSAEAGKYGARPSPECSVIPVLVAILLFLRPHVGLLHGVDTGLVVQRLTSTTKYAFACL
jgi:hypothetical protein